MEEVFVYGTLMPGERNEPTARQAGMEGAVPALVSGMRLYHLEPEGYPALVQGSSVVHGFVLSVADLAPLDALEGLDESPPLYRRELCRPSGWRRDVWIYLYAREERLGQPGAFLVDGGRWSGQLSFVRRSSSSPTE